MCCRFDNWDHSKYRQRKIGTELIKWTDKWHELVCKKLLFLPAFYVDQFQPPYLPLRGFSSLDHLYNKNLITLTNLIHALLQLDATPHDPNTMSQSPESDVTSMNLDDTELTLRLPGESRSPQLLSGGNKSSPKRGFIETVDLKLGSSLSTTDTSQSRVSGTGKCPPTK